MFDTMTTTKIIGGFCGTFLVFLLGGWAAELIYHSGGGGHGDHHEQAYVIPVEDDTAVAEAVEEGPPFEELFAVADAGAGEGEFRPCAACHALDGSDGVGPHLDGVVGRALGAIDGFSYSDGFAEVAAAWTPADLDAFLENPKAYAPDTAMNFRGIRDAQDRANLIAYLATYGG